MMDEGIEGLPEATGLKILVVDDEPLIRNLCQTVLTEVGHLVDISPSADEARSLIAQEFDIVITDLDMPGRLKGLDLVRLVREKSSADVLIMTGHPELKTAVQAVRDGAYDYLIKPFNIETLRIAVNRCADKRRLSRELAREKSLREELSNAYAELSRMEKVRHILGQFATPEVARLVMDHPDDFWKQGERREVTVMFADVRNFTPFAGKIAPEAAVMALNYIFDDIIRAVQAEGGIINKFLGDGLMALFGAPVSRPDHAEAAARAALAAQKAVQANVIETDGCGPLRIGIALNTGLVIAGCLGAQQRTEYTVIGQPVNLAARLEKIAEANQILLGPSTAKLLSGRFRTRHQQNVTLAGFDEPIRVSALLGFKPARKT